MTISPVFCSGLGRYTVENSLFPVAWYYLLTFLVPTAIFDHLFSHY